MGRHAARRAAMQLIYERMMGGEGSDETLSDLVEAQLEEEDYSYITALVEGASAHSHKLDAIVERLSTTRELGRIPAVVRAILRLSLYELSIPEEVPASVVVNEAVELARMYGQESDGRFVNGVLGTYLRETAAG